jgi:hypothetical protein
MGKTALAKSRPGDTHSSKGVGEKKKRDRDRHGPFGMGMGGGEKGRPANCLGYGIWLLQQGKLLPTCYVTWPGLDL